jgi:short-subunit dehydrogenase
MHALITGASSGIGEALAVAFAREGYDLTLVARRAQELERVAASIPRARGDGRRVHVIAFDLAGVDPLKELMSRARDSNGPLDVLVNNAGLSLVGHTHEISDEQADQVMRVNLLAPLDLMRHALGPMVERGSGTVVNVASVSALAPTPYSFHYNAAKAGLAAASESLWEEARRRGVHVLTVYPGPVKTALLERAMAKMPKNTPRNLEGTTTELAERILEAMRSRRARLVYPRPYAVTRMLPGISRWALDRFFPEIASDSHV